MVDHIPLITCDCTEKKWISLLLRILSLEYLCALAPLREPFSTDLPIVQNLQGCQAAGSAGDASPWMAA